MRSVLLARTQQRWAPQPPLPVIDAPSASILRERAVKRVLPVWIAKPVSTGPTHRVPCASSALKARFLMCWGQLRMEPARRVLQGHTLQWLLRPRGEPVRHAVLESFQPCSALCRRAHASFVLWAHTQQLSERTRENCVGGAQQESLEILSQGNHVSSADLVHTQLLRELHPRPHA